MVDLEGKNPLSCTITTKGACEEANGSLISVTPVDLPWTTSVALSGTAFTDAITKEPGYLIECKALGIKVDDTCKGNTSTELVNVATGVEGIFSESETITPAANCTIGGEKAGLAVGSGITTHLTGGTLSVSE